MSGDKPRMPTLISGFGTAYVGKRDIAPDGSHVTTEWVMLFYLPVIPIRSFGGWSTGQSQRYVF